MSSLPELAKLLGGDVSGSQVLAPGPGHSRRDRSLSVMLSPSAPDGFVVTSFAGDDWRDCRDHVRERLGVPRETGPHRPQKGCRPTPKDRGEGDEQRAHSLAQAAVYVREMRPVHESPGEFYLRETRRIDVQAISDVLEGVDAIGWHHAVYFHEPDHPMHGRRLGCIIGVMTDPITALPTGAISRTYIDENLQKVGKAKTLGSPGGVVRLSPDEDVTYGLFLAEGLETAATAMAKEHRPIWSTGSTAHMKAFPVLNGIDCLTIIADHDKTDAGEKAAREVEARWRLAGREAHIFMPETFGDLNDLLRRAKG
jgi:putative DNA primase/helicase